jgi:hypothetical protein
MFQPIDEVPQDRSRAMKKLVAMLVGIGFTLACGDSVTEPGADPLVPAFSAHSKGAVVHKNEGEGIPFGGCSVLDGSGAFFPPDFTLPCGTEVATFSNRMNAKISVQAEGVPNPTGGTVIWGPYNVGGTEWAAQFDGSIPGFPVLSGPPFPCFLLGTDYDLANPLWTVKWKQTVSASGNASLVCHYSEKWAFDCNDYGNCG